MAHNNQRSLAAMIIETKALLEAPEQRQNLTACANLIDEVLHPEPPAPRQRGGSVGSTLLTFALGAWIGSTMNSIRHIFP